MPASHSWKQAEWDSASKLNVRLQAAKVFSLHSPLLKEENLAERNLSSEF